MELEPYLFFNGQCEEALSFYSRIFGGKIESLMRFEGTPMEADTPPEYKKKVMHARFKSPTLKFMASDGRPGSHQESGNISLSIDSRSLAEAQRVWQKLAEGGKVEMPFGDTFWGAKFGTLTDKFGIDWMVNCALPKQGASRTTRARRARPARGRPARGKGGSRRARR
jgi:PhnB protein